MERPQAWSGAGDSLIVRRDGAVHAKGVSHFGAETLYADLPVAEPAALK